MRRILLFAAGSLGLLAHAAALAGAWEQARVLRIGNDFASYYCAAAVVAEGGDPYLLEGLRGCADEVTRGVRVFPYLYPPAFLLGFGWAPALELASAYRLWFWLNEVALIAALSVLAWRWRPLGASAPWVTLAALGAFSFTVNNHLMGQVNWVILVLTLAGLSLVERRPLAGGALVGAAAIGKMAPALWVLLWAAQRRGRAFAGALAAGALLSLLSLAVVPWGAQRRFWGQVLWGFADGDYNGLRVPIGIFGNHSLPDLWNALWPAAGWSLSPEAKIASALSVLALVGSVGWALRRRPRSPWGEAASLAAVGLLLLLVPVYTYEHHLVWALPAAVLLAVALIEGRLSPRWWAVVIPAWAGLAAPLALLKRFAASLDPLPAFALEEWKHAALWLLLAGSIYLGWVAERDFCPQDRA